MPAGGVSEPAAALCSSPLPFVVFLLVRGSIFSLQSYVFFFFLYAWNWCTCTT